ncbi:MAG: TlpA family protein disulfide reductase [Promethearchaeota archaeon]
MVSNVDLKWKDIRTPTMTPEEYLNKFGEKVVVNYKTYEPKQHVIERIKKKIKEKKEKLKIIALGADWCPDCSKNIPQMIKIIKLVNYKNIEFHILYGIMVNAFHKPGEVIWHKNHSPPEAVDPKFGLKAIPTFYFFNKIGDLIGIIVEHPKLNSSLEEDMLEILEKKV